MDEEGALFDSGFDDNGPFRVTPEAGGISLESALRDFGPAAIDDLIPRIRAIAGTLDAAHANGVIHGALHPSKVIVTDEGTSLLAGDRSALPYIAPELIDGGRPSPPSDQFALAAITYEWLFGRPITGAAERAVELRTMPGVDRAALSKAFTRALAPDPANRFASCLEFCDAVAASVEVELPLLPLVPAEAFDVDAGSASLDDDWPGPNVDDLKIVAEESILTAAPFDSDRDDAFLAQGRPPDLDTLDTSRSPERFEALPERESAVASWNPSATASATPSHGGASFGGFALILAAIVGAVFGFAAGYMARPRALQGPAPAQITVAPGTDAPIAGATGATSATGATGAPSAPSASSAPAPVPDSPATRVAPAPAAPVAPAAPAKNVGRLLVRSSPSGASVTVDGVARGVTPLALRDLSVGTRRVVVARRGYIPETRTVSITAARPSRTLDVRLGAEATAKAPPRSASAAKGRSGETSPELGRSRASVGGPVSTGSLAIESRPVGAAVSVNGTPRGKTPLTINDLAPGEYRILLSMPGYRSFTTTVRVVAGERVRAAASLTAQEQE